MSKIVKNLKRSSDLNCKCPKSKSWLDHWEIQSNRIATCCAACGETNDLIGGHVIKAGADKTRYIVPLCKKCNRYQYHDPRKNG